MKYILFILCFAFTFFVDSSAQTNGSCYQQLKAKGIKAYNNFYFEKAIRLFKAARICTDRPVNSDIEKLLESARTGYVEKIKEAREQAENAEKKAKQSAEEAHREKVKAENSAKRSEAGKLAFQARVELEKSNSENALCLAREAYKLVKDKPLTLVKRAFGDATYQYSRKKSKRLSSGVQHVAFSPSGDQVLCVTLDQKVAVLNNDHQLDSLSLLFETPPFKLPISFAGFSPDGEEILIVSHSIVNVFDLKGNLIRGFSRSEKIYRAATFAHNESKLLFCPDNAPPELWDKQGNLLLSLNGRQVKVFKAIFSPQDNFILTLSRDKSFGIWSGDGQLIAIIDQNDAQITDARFSSDESKILISYVDGTIKIFDINGKLLNTLIGHTDIVRTAVFSKSGKYIVSCSADNSLILWNDAGEKLAQMDQHLGDVRSVDFSSDDQFILSCSMDGTAKFWNLEGELLMNLDHHTHSVNQAIFSPDSNKILTCSENNSFILLSYTPQYMHSNISNFMTDSFCKDRIEQLRIE